MFHYNNSCSTIVTTRRLKYLDTAKSIMDNTDQIILSKLRGDGRKSFIEIGREVGLTEGAVRARIGKMVRSGTIKKFTVETKDEVKAIVMVATSRAVSTTGVTDAIRRLGIDRTYEISGNFDIVCFVESNSMEDVNETVERIRAINGVTDTTTSLVLK